MNSSVRNILAAAGRIRIRSGYLQMIDLLCGLAARGAGISLICDSIPPELSGRKWPFAILSWNDVIGRWPLGGAPQFRQLCEREKFEVIHVHGTGLSRSAERAVRLSGLPVVFTPHTESGDRSAVRRITRFSQRVVAMSEFRRQGLVNRCRLPREKVRVIMPGVELARYNLLPPQKNGHLPVVGTVAPLEPGRGQACFLEAARLVLESGRGAEFAVAGDGREEGTLRRKAAALGIQKRVVFATRLSNYSGAISVLDIFVRPAVRGGIGYTILEAMAMGKAIVATATGDVPELIEDGRTGLMTPKDDPAALAEMISRLLDQPQMSRQLGTEARASIAQEFNMDRLVRDTQQIYGEAEEVFSRKEEVLL